MGITGQNFNVSEKYKAIWLAPERTGSRKVSEVLAFYDFKQNDEPIFYFGNYNFSHVTPNDGRYSDYKIISNARNPYSRVYSLFKNYYRESLEKNKDNFKKYLTEGLVTGQMETPTSASLVETLNNIKNMVINPILSRVPDHIIRLEYMTEDLMKIPFIYDVLNKKQIEMLSQHGKDIDEWECFYDQESKDIVYEKCKDHFIYWGYEK
jgi:hypothetical protein